MFGLSDLTSVSVDLPPSARSEGTPPPISLLFPIQNALDASCCVLGLFSYLPASVIVLRCAAARLGRLQSLPFDPTYTPVRQQLLKSNAFRALLRQWYKPQVTVLGRKSLGQDCHCWLN